MLLCGWGLLEHYNSCYNRLLSFLLRCEARSARPWIHFSGDARYVAKRLAPPLLLSLELAAKLAGSPLTAADLLDGSPLDSSLSDALAKPVSDAGPADGLGFAPIQSFAAPLSA